MDEFDFANEDRIDAAINGTYGQTLDPLEMQIEICYRTLKLTIS